MPEPTIRLHLVDEAGVITDAEENFALADFAGTMPVAGDRWVRPLPREWPDDKPLPPLEMLEIVGRVFNPRGHRDFVALICRARAPTVEEREVMPDEDEA